MSKTRKLKVTLFHCLPHRLAPFLQSGVYLLGGGYGPFPEHVTQDEERKKKLSHLYVKTGAERGVSVEIEFNSGEGNIAQAILEQASAMNVELIALAAESGPVSATLVGSVTRQVVREAPCPVWVVRT